MTYGRMISKPAPSNKLPTRSLAGLTRTTLSNPTWSSTRHKTRPRFPVSSTSQQTSNLTSPTRPSSIPTADPSGNISTAGTPTSNTSRAMGTWSSHQTIADQQGSDANTWNRYGKTRVEVISTTSSQQSTIS